VPAGNDHATVDVAIREALVAFRIVLRTFAESAAPGELHWTCDGASVVLNTGTASLNRCSNTDLASDRFVGLGLVGRLCTRLGWVLTLGEDADGRLVAASLRFARAHPTEQVVAIPD